MLGNDLVGGLCLPLVWRRAAPVLVVPPMVAFEAALLYGRLTAGLRWDDLVTLTSALVAAAPLGVTMRIRRAYLAELEERAERLLRERDQQAHLAAAAERVRSWWRCPMARRSRRRSLPSVSGREALAGPGAGLTIHRIVQERRARRLPPRQHLCQRSDHRVPHRPPPARQGQILRLTTPGGLCAGREFEQDRQLMGVARQIEVGRALQQERTHRLRTPQVAYSLCKAPLQRVFVSHSLVSCLIRRVHKRSPMSKR